MIASADHDLLATLARNPGMTEASARSHLRREYGDSAVLDIAIAVGRVIRRGHKLYRIEDDPAQPPERFSDVTAETITDEQIYELLASGTRKEATLCEIAIHGPTQAQLNRGMTRKLARARCAEILNARGGAA